MGNAGELSQKIDCKVGAYLRLARENSGRSISTIAEEIIVPQHYLVAIEDDDFESLPGQTYAVGFVKNYCRALNIDSDPVIARLRAQVTFPDAIDSAGIVQGFVDPPRQTILPSAPSIVVGLLVAMGVYGLWFAAGTNQQIMTPPQLALNGDASITAGRAAGENIQLPAALSVEQIKPAMPKPTSEGNAPREAQAQVGFASAPMPAVDLLQAARDLGAGIARMRTADRRGQAYGSVETADQVNPTETSQNGVKRSGGRVATALASLEQRLDGDRVSEQADVAGQATVESAALDVIAAAPGAEAEDVQGDDASVAAAERTAERTANAKIASSQPSQRSVVPDPRASELAAAGVLPDATAILVEKDSWIEIRSNGRVLVSGVKKAGQRIEVPYSTARDAEMVTGNAGGIRLAVGEWQSSLLGEEGLVKRGISLEPQVVRASFAASGAS